MAKWLAGCLALVVVVGIALIWFGYRKIKEFTGAGPSTNVTINAPPARVFASLANVDSMKQWRQVASVSSTRTGMLQVGDTLRTQMRLPSDTTNRISHELVSVLVPDRLMVLETLGDATSGSLVIRRDSLVGEGDSTRLFTTFFLPATDSARAELDTTSAGKRERRMMDMASSLVVSVMRMQAGVELRRLKARIEGTPVPAAPLPAPPLPAPPRSPQ